MFQKNSLKWLWKIVFLPSWEIFVAILLYRRTNNLVFDIEMVKSGEQFYIPRIILQFLFNFKETKPWSVNVEAVTEAVSVFFKYLVHKLIYRCKATKTTCLKTTTSIFTLVFVVKIVSYSNHQQKTNEIRSWAWAEGLSLCMPMLRT